MLTEFLGQMQSEVIETDVGAGERIGGAHAVEPFNQHLGAERGPRNVVFSEQCEEKMPGHQFRAVIVFGEVTGKMQDGANLVTA